MGFLQMPLISCQFLPPQAHCRQAFRLKLQGRLALLNHSFHLGSSFPIHCFLCAFTIPLILACLEKDSSQNSTGQLIQTFGKAFGKNDYSWEAIGNPIVVPPSSGASRHLSQSPPIASFRGPLLSGTLTTWFISGGRQW